MSFLYPESAALDAARLARQEFADGQNIGQPVEPPFGLLKRERGEPPRQTRHVIMTQERLVLGLARQLIPEQTLQHGPVALRLGQILEPSQTVVDGAPGDAIGPQEGAQGIERSQCLAPLGGETTLASGTLEQRDAEGIAPTIRLGPLLGGMQLPSGA